MYSLNIGSSDGIILAGHCQEKWYFEWTWAENIVAWPEEVIYWLDLGTKWCTR